MTPAQLDAALAAIALLEDRVDPVGEGDAAVPGRWSDLPTVARDIRCSAIVGLKRGVREALTGERAA